MIRFFSMWAVKFLLLVCLRNVKINISIRSYRVELNIICFIIILYDIRINFIIWTAYYEEDRWISFSTNSMNIVQITAYLSIINQQRIFPHFLQLFAIFFFFINFFIFEVSRHFFFYRDDSVCFKFCCQRKKRKEKKSHHSWDDPTY